MTKNTLAANLTLGAQLVNDSIRTVNNIRDGTWWWLESVPTVLTGASQQAYQVPAKLRKLMDLYVQVGSGATAVIYTPFPVYDADKWKWILASRMAESDIPLFYYRQGNNQVLLAPSSSSAGNTIFMRGRLNTIDLSIADYTAGTIVSVTNGDETVTGSGTTWNASMVGRFIKIDDSDAANSGDNRWYEIASVTDTTHLELVKPYNGTTIAAASLTYTIGQMSLIPEAYDVAPLYRASAIYWQNESDLNKSNMYWRMYDGGVEAGLSKEYGGIIGQMLENEGETVEGSYLRPFGNLPIVPQGSAFSPWEIDASGF
jgi:hypothetical protein